MPADRIDKNVKTGDGESCPLCNSVHHQAYHQDSRRVYRQCPRCALVFVPAAYHLDANAEKAEYDLHENDPDDPAYRRFLGRLFQPLRQRLDAGQQGLDFGCGSGPALASLFAEHGYPMRLYDPYYAPWPEVFEQTYDFITATEVVEHLGRPGREIARLYRILKPGGYLGVMTQMVLGREAFSRWRYKDDLTHISFFSRASFTWLSGHLPAQLEFHDRDIVLLRKPPASGDPGLP